MAIHPRRWKESNAGSIVYYASLASLTSEDFASGFVQSAIEQDLARGVRDLAEIARSKFFWIGCTTRCLAGILVSWITTSIVVVGYVSQRIAADIGALWIGLGVFLGVVGVLLIVFAVLSNTGKRNWLPAQTQSAGGRPELSEQLGEISEALVKLASQAKSLSDQMRPDA
jgi:hypothetical protein